eukprot:408447_1
MGCICSSGTYNARIVFVGLDNAGKSTILHCLAEGKAPSTQSPTPTIGYQQRTIHRSKIELQIWDVGGDVNGRDLWRHYLKNAQAVVFILDASDTYHLDQCGDDSAKQELHRVLKNDELPFTSPLLICSNKMDKSGALNKEQIEKRLNLSSIRTRPWHIQATCAINNTGIEEGIDWLCQALHRQLKASKGK